MRFTDLHYFTCSVRVFYYYISFRLVYLDEGKRFIVLYYTTCFMCVLYYYKFFKTYIYCNHMQALAYAYNCVLRIDRQENAYLYAWRSMYTSVDMHARTREHVYMYVCKGGTCGGGVNILKTPLMHVAREGREIGLTGRCSGRDNGLHK